MLRASTEVNVILPPATVAETPVWLALALTPATTSLAVMTALAVVVLVHGDAVDRERVGLRAAGAERDVREGQCLP